MLVDVSNHCSKLVDLCGQADLAPKEFKKLQAHRVLMNGIEWTLDHGLCQSMQVHASGRKQYLRPIKAERA